MGRILAVCLALLILIFSGWVHGRWTYRWQDPQEMTRALGALQRIPLTVGDWQGRDQEMDPEQIRRAGISGYIVRRYEHQVTHAVVSILLVGGRWGQVAVHPPDVCYQGAGYELVGDKQRFQVPAANAPLPEMWLGNFRKQRGVSASYLRIFWGWSNSGVWKAPDNPRLTFGGSPVLFKLYVIREMASQDEPAAEDPALDLMNHLLPQINPVIFDGQ